MISVEQALARICGSILPLPTELVGLTDGLGRPIRVPIGNAAHPDAARCPESLRCIALNRRFAAM